MEENNEITTAIEEEYHRVWLYAGWIKDVYPLLNKYFEFGYADIGYELSYSLRDTFDCHTTYLETGTIEHLSDDFKIYFPIDRNDYGRIKSFANSYEIGQEEADALLIIIILLYVYVKNIRNQLYAIEYSNEVPSINEEKRKLYEFLLDNPHEFNDLNRAKARMEIHYGWDSQIEIDNYDNWLDNLLKRKLHDDLTLGGRYEYDQSEEPARPSNAPKFHNFIVYNLYLLLTDTVGSTKEYPAEFSKFIIDFCDLSNVELIGRQHEVLGIKDLIRGAKKQYNGQPIPLSLLR